MDRSEHWTCTVKLHQVQRSEKLNLPQSFSPPPLQVPPVTPFDNKCMTGNAIYKERSKIYI